MLLNQADGVCFIGLGQWLDLKMSVGDVRRQFGFGSSNVSASHCPIAHAPGEGGMEFNNRDVGDDTAGIGGIKGAVNNAGADLFGIMFDQGAGIEEIHRQVSFAHHALL